MLKNPTKIIHSTFILVFVLLLALAFWCLIFPITVILQSLPINDKLRRYVHIYVTQFVGMFIELIITFVQIFGGVKLIDYAVDDHLTKMNKHENALIISNHPTMFDWMYMWGFLARYSKVAHFKVCL